MVPLYLNFAFVPGLLQTSTPWQPLMPDSVVLVPVEYQPLPVRTADFIDVAALRLLIIVLRLAAIGPWALAGYSVGGTVVYQCLDYLADLQSPTGATALLRKSSTCLHIDEHLALQFLLEQLHRKPVRPPVMVLSFEGTLLPCDVLGWVQQFIRFANPPPDPWLNKALSDPQSDWTWGMAQECAASCLLHCGTLPASHLESVRRWLKLPDGPGLVYIAGEESAERNSEVFPALRACVPTTKPDSLLLLEVPHAGHKMTEAAPEAVRDLLARLLGNQTPWSFALTSSSVSQHTRGFEELISLFLFGSILIMLSFLLRPGRADPGCQCRWRELSWCSTRQQGPSVQAPVEEAGYVPLCAERRTPGGAVTMLHAHYATGEFDTGSGSAAFDWQATQAVQS